MAYKLLGMAVWKGAKLVHLPTQRPRLRAVTDDRTRRTGIDVSCRTSFATLPSTRSDSSLCHVNTLQIHGRPGSVRRSRCGSVTIVGAKIQRNVPLDKLLGAPELYSGQFVSLEQVYCIGDIAARRPDGTVTQEPITITLD